MKIDVLVAEIGSTTTVVNGFDGIGTATPRLVGQGMAPTSVLDGDVCVGLNRAIADLKHHLNVKDLAWGEMLATCSAAGGLTMTVHGLVYDMTAKAAKEAALGSGAVLKAVTAGHLRPSDLAKIQTIKPRMILVAGGVEHGERDTAYANFERIARTCPNIPLVYAGNSANYDDIREIAEQYKTELVITENVYPAIDRLNVAPAREAIQELFEKHIMDSPGMEHIRTLVDSSVMPTPGAVMQMAQEAYKELGDLLVIDVGGATTDLHSVTMGSDEVIAISVAAEPIAKRSVEGDLGVFLNRHNVLSQIDNPEQRFPNYEHLLEITPEIPTIPEAIRFIEGLTQICAETGLRRHAGTISEVYGIVGRSVMAVGKDLTAVRHIIGTGGALTRLDAGRQILMALRQKRQGRELFPTLDANILLDNHYIMASLGVMSRKYPKEALQLFLTSLEE